MAIPNSPPNPDSGADPGGVTPSHDIPPFRESGSGASYSPDGNWGAERQDAASADGAAERVLGDVDGLGAPASSETMAGAPTDAGDGGFGPEGGYSGNGQPGVESAGGAADDESENHTRP